MSVAKLSNKLAGTLAGYRAADGYTVNPDHVGKWIYQFEEDVREPLLAEMCHVMGATYFSKDEVREFFKHQIRNEKFASGDPEQFWREANILDIQAKGQSQSEISAEFHRSLDEVLGLKAEECGQKNETYVYLDDAIFSGSRAGYDLSDWIANHAPAKATLKILVIAAYRLGEFYLEKNLKEAARKAGKAISISTWTILRLENRKFKKNETEVLWPKDIPDDPAVKRYLAQEHKFPLDPRSADAKLEHPVFSGSAGRNLLEREMLKAGARIREFSQNPSNVVRPLGFGSFGVGFGSTVVTYRNCPNNCPLAWWWGDPNFSSNHPFSKWYPLVQRKTYGGIGFDDLDF